MDDKLDQLLNEKYTSVFRKGYGTFRGTVLPISFKNYQRDIENLKIKDDDVIVTSFAKSGTTWTQEMVWLLINDLNYEGAKVILDERSPFMELGVMLDTTNYRKQHTNIVFPEFILDPIGTIDRMKGRRCLKTHLPWNLLPLEIQNYTKKPKIIHVIRNPKDVCVSFHYHTRAVEGCRGDLEDTFNLFIAGKLHYTPYWPNILSFWEKRHLPNMLIITYEEMKKDLPSIIRKVAHFLEKNLNEEQIKTLSKHLSFEEMKKNNAVNFQATTAFVKTANAEKYVSDGIFMRSGEPGNHKADLSPEQIEALNKWIDENTVETELKF